MRIVLFAGLVPAIILLVYIYRLDRIEQEPVGLIIRLLVYGALTTIAASALESAGGWLLDTFGWQLSDMSYALIENFIVVAMVEEGVKYYALRKSTWYRPEFNYRFDAVIYAVSVSLGFAACENVLYILNFGLGVAPIRAITAIPMHCICGVFMGHYYGEAKFAEGRQHWSTMSRFSWAAWIVPVLLHGFYDFAASAQDGILATLFLIYVVIVDIVAFVSVRHYAQEDVMV